MLLEDFLVQYNKEKELNGVTSEQIEQTLFIAFNVALDQTIEEAKLNESGENLKKMTEGYKSTQQFLDEGFVKSREMIVVNEKGETFRDVFTRNFTSFLEEVDQKLIKPTN